ncbi:Uncharacterised protein g7936 [Pycnogonum litorale]
MSNISLLLFYYVFFELLDANKVCGTRCRYTSIYGSGTEHTFRCGAFEVCCGDSCCRTRLINFYQIWYFWVLMALLFLLCGGGGFWAKRHYYSPAHPVPTVMSTTTVPNVVSSSVSGSHPPGTSVFYQIGGYGPYPAYGSVVVTGHETVPSYPTVQTVTSSSVTVPPPYTGPPPSYETICKPGLPFQQQPTQ